MINRLRIKNFKTWRDTGDLRLAPITVLFGGNSSGKSSIPQLLLLLKQTAESADRQRALHFGDHRTPVDLGDFSAVLYGHDSHRSLEVELEWELPKKLELTDAYHDKAYSEPALPDDLEGVRSQPAKGVLWSARADREIQYGFDVLRPAHLLEQWNRARR